MSTRRALAWGGKADDRDDRDARGVRFDTDFLARISRFAVSLEASRRRREGPGSASAAGAGEDWVGYRPYRPGDDVRALDWNLLARLDRPFVKVTRREVSERWALLLDASGSMGVGRPGKLQTGAELALALGAIGVQRGARVTLLVAGAERRALEIARREDLGRAMTARENCRAKGAAGLGALLSDSGTALVRGAGRVCLIGDLLDLERERALCLARPGTELLLAQVLAARELDPLADLDGARAAEFIDAEVDDALELALDSGVIERYGEALGARLEAWGVSARRHRARFACIEAHQPFEESLPRLLLS